MTIATPGRAWIGPLALAACAGGAAAAWAGGSAAGDPAIVLGRPTDRSSTLNVLAAAACQAYVEVHDSAGAAIRETAVAALPAATPVEIVLDGLLPDRAYGYRLQCRPAGSAAFTPCGEGTFHTARARGSAFTFAVEADPHLDANTSPELLARTFAAIAADRPDFLVDLGDSFMSDKAARTRAAVLDRHLLLRDWFAGVCHSLPLFLVLGNHEGESLAYLDGSAENLAVWATTTRNAYFPNPAPDDFFSGDGSSQPLVGVRRSIYAWEWGDALLVVLDPYWYTTGRPGAEGDNWVRTLGREQYLWLQQVLSASSAAFKLVFIHNLVGGLDASMRGGAEAAPLYEWGGRNADSSWGFAARRPGWERPIHEVLVAGGVDVVFHGHDHLYARQELDGVVYQEVPQPGWPGLELRSAGEYGYRSGVLLPSSGYLRVTVSAVELEVEYVTSYLERDETATRRHGEIAHAYTLRPPPAARAPRRRLGSAR